MSAPSPPGHDPYEAERILSAGLPPGYNPEESHQASAPAAVTYMRAYGGIVGALYLIGGLFIVGILVKEALTKTGGDVFGSAVFAIFGGTWCGVMAASHLAVVVGGRRPWVHTVATVAVAFDLTSACCWLPGIPLLIIWLKPEVKAFYTDAVD